MAAIIKHIPITGMSCAGCVGRVQKALAALPAVSNAQVNLASESATVTLQKESGVNDVLQALQMVGYPAQTEDLRLEITNMSCASCVGRVEKALAAIPGVISADVNLASEMAQLRVAVGQVDVAQVLAVAEKAGYPARITGQSTAPDNRKEDEARDLFRMTVIAAALALPVFVVEMGGHLFPPLHHLIARTIGLQTSWVLQFLLTALVLAWPGRGFYQKGLPALLRGAPDMNSLVAVGTLAAFGFSTVVTFAPGLIPESSRVVYFESAAVIVVLILLGRSLEARAKGQTGQAIRKLMGLRPKQARVRRGEGTEMLAIEALEIGDVIELRPGEQVAVDGQVVDGSSWIDESMITGEPDPVEKKTGAEVTGGTVNGTGALSYRATAVGQDTRLSQIVRMVQEAQGAKLPIQGVVDQITLWFVPAVLAIATLTAIVWLIVGPSLASALVAAVAVLIIACPCAMGLATPTSIMVGTGRAAELGVLFRKGDALQSLQSVQIVAFDKTGTLTAGKPVLTDLELAPGFERAAVLATVAAIESRSEHPIAQALVAAAEGLELPKVEAFQSITGHGVSATVDGTIVLIGADRLMRRENVAMDRLEQTGSVLGQEGKTPLYVAIGGQIAAVIAVSDPIKEGSPAAIAALKRMGLQIAMITGDNQGTAEAIAARLGIDHVVAEVLPEGKVAALNSLRDGGRALAFVGDGINDAPALAHADVGVAIGTGTDVAIEAADVVLMQGDLRGVVTAFDMSRRTMGNIRQNLIWAFGYNVALIPVAAGVFFPLFGWLLSPMLAAGAMALSSVFVLSNALRLRWITPMKGDEP